MHRGTSTSKLAPIIWWHFQNSWNIMLLAHAALRMIRLPLGVARYNWWTWTIMWIFEYDDIVVGFIKCMWFGIGLTRNLFAKLYDIFKVHSNCHAVDNRYHPQNLRAASCQLIAHASFNLVGRRIEHAFRKSGSKFIAKAPQRYQPNPHTPHTRHALTCPSFDTSPQFPIAVLYIGRLIPKRIVLLHIVGSVFEHSVGLMCSSHPSRST